MNELTDYLSTFLREYLPSERGMSQHTCDTYAYTFQLLICFAAEKLKRKPSKLTLECLDVSLVVDFLNQLEKIRKNSARTRNARLAAIKAFFRFLEYRVPSALDQARRIFSIPIKRFDEKLVDFLTRREMQALLNSPDSKTTTGIRDRAMLYLTFAAGLRVSELIELQFDQISLGSDATIRVRGKGRRERIIPLWKETAAAIRAWIAVRNKNSESLAVFINAKGTAMTRFGFRYILAKYVNVASAEQTSLADKRISPHVLRHTCAMHTLQATHDVRKVSLWLGHANIKSTEIYLRADPTKKMEALTAGSPIILQRGNFKPPDKLIAMLRSKNKG